MSLDRGDVLLAQATTRWKVINSLWIVVVVAGFGCLSVFGWAWAAVLAHSRRVWIAVTIWSVGTAALVFAIVMASPEGSDGPRVEPWDTISTAAILLVWLGGSIHALLLARPVLKDRLVYLDKINAAIAAHRTPYQAHPSPTTPPTQSFLGVSGGDYYGPGETDSSRPASPAPPSPQPAPPDPQPAGPPPTAEPLLDLNAAVADEIAALPRLDAAAVAAILAARAAKGGFRDFDDLLASTSLQPHQVARLRDAVRFGPFRPPPSATGSGRVLDL